MKILNISLLVIFLASCTSITKQIKPVASPEMLAPGNALIIVERKKEDNASIHLVEVTDNNEVIGELGVGTGSRDRRDYHQLVWQRPAGEMSLKLSPKTMVKDLPALIENVEAGKTYKYKVEFQFSKYSLVLVKD